MALSRLAVGGPGLAAGRLFGAGAEYFPAGDHVLGIGERSRGRRRRSRGDVSQRGQRLPLRGAQPAAAVAAAAVQPAGEFAHAGFQLPAQAGGGRGQVLLFAGVPVQIVQFGPGQVEEFKAVADDAQDRGAMERFAAEKTFQVEVAPEHFPALHRRQQRSSLEGRRDRQLQEVEDGGHDVDQAAPLRQRQAGRQGPCGA